MSRLPPPPIPARRPWLVTLHGDTRQDDWFWLREKGSPEVEAHLRAENAYAEAAMAHLAPLRDKLYAEMLGRIQETDLSVPYPFAGWLWYRRTERGRQYPIHCRRRMAADAPEQVVLDLNQLAEGKDFLALGAFEISADGERLAYALDESGHRDHTLRVRDLTAGVDFPDRIERVESVAWAGDGRTLFYTVEQPDTKRPYRAFRHVLGQGGADPLLLEEDDERFNLYLRRSRSLEWIFLESHSLTSSEVRLLRAAEPSAAPRLVAAREPDHEYDVDHRGERFYIRTSGGGRRNFRLVTAPLDDPSPGSWEELVPHREDVMLLGVDLFAGHYVRFERARGLPRLIVVDLASGSERPIETPETSYAIRPATNEEFHARGYRYCYESFITPPSIYEIDLATGHKELLKREPVLGGFDPGHYEVRRLEIRAADGTPVPVSMALRRGRVPGAPGHPLVLSGYGAYGVSLDDYFSSERLSLLDRGVVIATAHPRGGGELGKRWHDAGRMEHKPTTFTDFIAVAEGLQALGWTAPDRLIISGGSAGGLLVGAVLNLRPELFLGAVALVPFVDIINTMSDGSLPLTVAEFEEWGNPLVEADYRVMRSYSPYENVRPQAYPWLFIRSSYNDSQVPYWEPAKWAARLRTTRTDDRPVLLKMNMEPAGHGGKSGRYDRLREVAETWAWVLDTLGIRD